MAKLAEQVIPHPQIVEAADSKGTKLLTEKQIDRHLPETLPARQSVVKLLLAAGVPNTKVIPAGAACLIEIVRGNAWLLGFFAANDSYETISSLRALAGQKTRQNIHTSGRAHAKNFFTIVGKPNSLPQIDKLRAVYLLAQHIYRSQAPSTRMGKEEIGVFGEFIRGLDNKSGSLIGAEALDSVFDATTLEQIGKTVESDLAHNKSQLAQDWRERWSPWIRLLSAQVRQQAPVDPDPTDLSRRSAAWPTTDDDEGGEPSLEFPPASLPATTDKGRNPPSASFAAAFTDQSLRSQNLELSKEHYSVATDAEIRVAIASCAALLTTSTRETGLDLAPCLLLLLIATGRQLPSLVDTQIHVGTPKDGARRLILDLKRGLLIQPVLIPEHIRRPKAEDEALFDTNTNWIELPLPPLVLNYLKRLYRWRKADRLIQWLDGIDPESMIRSFLRSIPQLQGRSRPSSAPYRRWLGCQLQEVGADFAKTMLLTGDSFGRSTAPLYYTSPRAHELTSLYRTALDGFFERLPLPELPPELARVGPAFITAMSVAKAGVSQASKRLNISPTKAIADLDKAARYHNAFTHYLTYHIAIVTSHRPNKALYGLTRRHFDLRRHFAVVQDKNADPEHFTRLVATTPALSECITNYLNHLQVLGSRLGNAESMTSVEKIRLGDVPLLQYLTGDGAFRSGTTEDLRSGTPEAWLRLPANWYRPLLSMQLRERGAQALAVLAHVGHLEAASHPFLSDSVLAPAEIADEVRPALMSLEKDLGFRVISGFGQGQKQVQPPALGDWESALQEHTIQYRAIVKDQAGLVRAGLKANREGAKRWLLETIGTINPTLLEIVRLVRVYRTSRKKALFDSTLVGVEIPDSDIEKLLEQNETEHQNNDPLRVATHNLLCRWLRQAATSAKTKVLDIGLINLSPRSELSPLLKHNCEATEQIEALRDWFQTQCRLRHNFPPQLLRVFALMLYEGLREVSEILALSLRDEIAPTFAGRGSVICVAVPGRRGPVTITGLPALALSVPLPHPAPANSVSALSALLAQYLPPQFIPSDPENTLQHWATTAQIASRIEQAGLFRYGALPEGVLEAPVSQQAAFFTKQFPAVEPQTDNLNTEDTTVTLDVHEPETQPGITEAPITSGVSKGLSRRYQRLIAAISNPAKVFSKFKKPLPVGVTASEQAKLSTILDALDLCEPRAETHPHLDIVSALAHFVRDMCINGTRRKAVPAVNTIYSYFTAIGSGLLDIFADTDLHTLLEEDLEDAYELFIKSSQHYKSSDRASMVLADFHLLLVNSFGLPEVQISTINSSGAISDKRPAPHLLTEAQYLAARQYLFDQVSMSAKHSFAKTSWRRVAFAAAVVLILLRRSGARISEIVLLRQTDIWQVGESIFVVIRPSAFRQLKTAAATRRVELTERLDKEEKRFVLVWLKSEKHAHQGPERRTLLFPALGQSDRALGIQLIRQTIQLAFRHGAGIEMHPHLTRHLFLTETTEQGAGAIANWIDLNKRVRHFECIRLGIGHTRLKTGTTSYVHTRLAVGRLSQRMSGGNRSDRWLLSAFSSKRVESIDKLRQRHCEDGADDLRLLWTDAIFVSSPNSRSPSVIDDPPQPLARGVIRHRSIPLAELDRYIRLVRNGLDSNTIAVSFGFSALYAQNVNLAITTLAQAPTFYRLIRTKTRKGREHMEPLPRDVDAALVARLYKRATPEICGHISRLFRRVYTPQSARLDSFTGSQEQLTQLQGLLMALGIHGRAFAIQSNQLKLHRTGQRVGLFHTLAWCLSILAVYDLSNP